MLRFYLTRRPAQEFGGAGEKMPYIFREMDALTIILVSWGASS